MTEKKKQKRKRPPWAYNPKDAAKGETDAEWRKRKKELKKYFDSMSPERRLRMMELHAENSARADTARNKTTMGKTWAPDEEGMREWRNAPPTQVEIQRRKSQGN